MGEKGKNEWYKNRLFYRPYINWLRVCIIIIISALVCYIVGGLLATALDINWLVTALTLCDLIILVFARRITVWCIRVYQCYAPLKTRSRCCCTPSCSEYAILALEKYGVVRGYKMTIDRLLRCHPPGGIDYP